MNNPPRIKEWLNERGVSDSVIEKYNIHWNGSHIVIPISESTNKYRRDPDTNEGPKYQYDKGACAMLYPEDQLSNDDIILCEGELDALCLISHGYHAVTTTGGASTFPEEWVTKFSNKNVVICYDNDEAGIKGALNLQAKMPFAKIVWIPEEAGVKDVTDYFKKRKSSTFFTLISEARSYNIPRKVGGDNLTTARLNENIKETTTIINDLMEEARVLRQAYASDKHIQILLNHCNTILADMKWMKKKMTRGSQENNKQSDEISIARNAPIPQYIQFRNRFARCIWHNESTASLYYYPNDNHVYCFGCARRGDAIDVVRAIKNLDFKQAVDFINGKPIEYEEAQ